MRSSLRFLENPLGSMPRARDSGDPRNALAIVGVRILPSALLTASASRSRLFSELNLHGLLPCCVRFITHQSPGEWQHLLPTCLLGFRRGRDRAEARALRHKSRSPVSSGPPAIPEGRISRFRFWPWLFPGGLSEIGEA